MRAHISRPVLEAILAHAQATPRLEVCGLLFGEGTAILRAEPAANVHPDPAGHFEVDPGALIAAHKAARAGGPRLIGHYHSHPSGSATASREDAAAAEPGQLCLIVAGGSWRLYRGVPEGLEPAGLDVA